MSGTKQKFEEFQLHVDKLEKDNSELHKNIEEQKAWVLQSYRSRCTAIYNLCLVGLYVLLIGCSVDLWKHLHV